MTTGTVQEADERAHEQDELTDDEHAMLELEQAWWKHPGARDGRIRETFDISPTIYYARLNALVDRPKALAAYPLVVRRLQKLRAARAQQRSSRRAVER